MQVISETIPPLPPESLSRLLRQWGLAPGSPPPAAARLGAWFGWADAVQIAQILGTSADGADSELARSKALAWASGELELVQAQLASSFHHAELASPSQSQAEDAPLAELLTPYLQHFVQQQRLVTSRLSTFRARLRTSLTGVSGELARLAQLDEYIERATAAPELRAMTALSAVLETRGRKHHAADPRRWRLRLWSDVQRLLRADLDQRLQPVLGLIEALSTHCPP